ncbi:MAG: hypothetical protein ACRD99_02615 [Nitrososphaera sp.]
MTSPYVSFPVTETIELRELADIRSAVDKMVESYELQMADSSFSYRILLPRGEKVTSKAKRLGVSLQGEFLLALRKKKLHPEVRELRYLHDENHYGWLLASPKIFERFENKA